MVFNPPSVFYQKINSNNIYSILLENSIPYRLCNYHNIDRGGPNFYLNKDMPIFDNQETIFKNSGYPLTNKTPSNFWGKKIPL